DAHADQVDADGVVAAQLLGQLELGAHAVGARDQDRFAVLARQVEQRAEAAQAAHDLGTEAAPDQRFDAFDDFVARVDVDAGVAVGQAAGGGGRVGHGAQLGRAARDSSSRGRRGPPGGWVGATGQGLCGTISQRWAAVKDCRMRLAVRGAWMIGWVGLALLLAAPAAAQRVEGDRANAEGLYEAEVPVRTQSESERTAGQARALAQVFAKLSGDRSITTRPGVVQELRRASEYV